MDEVQCEMKPGESNGSTAADVAHSVWRRKKRAEAVW